MGGERIFGADMVAIVTFQFVSSETESRHRGNVTRKALERVKAA